jgi:hypothetical protein
MCSADRCTLCGESKTEAFNLGPQAARSVQLKTYAVSNWHLLTGERLGQPMTIRGSPQDSA